MKRYFTLILMAAVLLQTAAVSAQSSKDSLAGMEIFRAASDYVFSGRKLSVVLTNIDKKGNPYYNTGFFVAVPDRGYMEIDGVSQFQFSPTVVSSYSYETNEYVIQKRKSSSESISDNPFSILSKSDKGIAVSEPKAGDVRGQSCTKISVTPKGKAYYARADIYVDTKAESLKVLRITVVIKKNQAFVVDIVKAGPSEPDKVGEYRLLVSDHPGAQTIDLRD